MELQKGRSSAPLITNTEPLNAGAGPAAVACVKKAPRVTAASVLKAKSRAFSENVLKIGDKNWVIKAPFDPVAIQEDGLVESP